MVGSGLGSGLYVCGSCGKPFPSGCRESAEMSEPGKLWYCFVSLVYVGFMGFLGGVVCKGSLQALFEGPQAYVVDLDGAAYWSGVLLVGSAVALVQWRRVIGSFRRTGGLRQPARLPRLCRYRTMGNYYPPMVSYQS